MERRIDARQLHNVAETMLTQELPDNIYDAPTRAIFTKGSPGATRNLDDRLFDVTPKREVHMTDIDELITSLKNAQASPTKEEITRCLRLATELRSRLERSLNQLSEAQTYYMKQLRSVATRTED